jgi:hypothetical protein
MMSYMVIYEGIYANLYFIRNIYVHTYVYIYETCMTSLTYMFRLCRVYVSYVCSLWGRTDRQTDNALSILIYYSGPFNKACSLEDVELSESTMTCDAASDKKPSCCWNGRLVAPNQPAWRSRSSNEIRCPMASMNSSFTDNRLDWDSSHMRFSLLWPWNDLFKAHPRLRS